MDPKQGINHAKFEIPPLNTVCEKANVKFSVKSENMSIISLMCKSEKLWYIHSVLELLEKLTPLQLNRINRYNFQLKLFDISVTLKCAVEMNL